MSDAIRDALPEPLRTPELPRNFAWAEFRRGTFVAWAAFQAIGVALLAWSCRDWAPAADDGPLGLIAAAAYFWLIGGVIVTALVTLLSAPLAYVIGHMLRRVSRDWIHLTAFSAYGFVVGYVPMWLLGYPHGSVSASFGLWSPMGCGLGAGVAVALGWLSTSRVALATDRAAAR